MLILTRREGERIVINGNIIITYLCYDDRHRNIKVGIEAPRSISVNRLEVQERIDEENKIKEENK